MGHTHKERKYVSQEICSIKEGVDEEVVHFQVGHLLRALQIHLLFCLPITSSSSLASICLILLHPPIIPNTHLRFGSCLIPPQQWYLGPDVPLTAGRCSVYTKL